MVGIWGKTSAGLGIGAALIASSAVLFSPAIGAVSDIVTLRGTPVSLDAIGSISSFTPVTKDRRLAEVYARAAVSAKAQGFRFTPSSSAMSGRSITVAVRASDRISKTVERATPSALTVAPFSYNLGSARGLNRFSTADASARSQSEPPIEIVRTQIEGFKLTKPTRFTVAGKVDREIAGTNPETLANESRYSVDVASSLRVTRNIDVRAGVRYRSDSFRLGPLTDDKQDSQAVYVGTAFKF